MFHKDIVCLEILSMYMTLILDTCDYPCGKEVSNNGHRGNVPYSANGNSQRNAGSSLICCVALGRPA